eukprot:s205_g36.t1
MHSWLGWSHGRTGRTDRLAWRSIGSEGCRGSSMEPTEDMEEHEDAFGDEVESALSIGDLAEEDIPEEAEADADSTEVEDIEALVTDVQDHVFGEMRLPEHVVTELQTAWNTFLAQQPSRDSAGEAIYGVIFDAAPELQHLFKTARSVMAMKFVNGLNMLVSELPRPTSLKVIAETLAFQHLDIDVTTPRAGVFRDAICELLQQELGSNLTTLAVSGLQALLNYTAGAMIYVRREYSERINILRASWIAASHARIAEQEEQAANGQPLASMDRLQAAAPEGESEPTSNSKRAKKIQATKVPENFTEMFCFNAAVMGFHMGINWMEAVLDQFENMVLNAANSNRLQEECDVLSLRLVKIKDPIVFAEFKAVMLASLRSLIPKVWGVEHEVAWTWFWDNLERMLKAQMGQLKGQQRAVDRFIRNLSEESIPRLCRDVYKRFFEQAPSGQNYFKQSTTRLYFIASKVMEMCLEIYKRPRELMEDISALGLRHVGYGIPTELFMPFVEAWSQSIYAMNVDEKTAAAIRWSLTLISKSLIRTIVEGSTLVMKAINTNSALKFHKAIAVTSRKNREQELLRVTVGTQSISPLLWAIKNGSFHVARAMIADLLTIRADRDNYYYGCDALFERHPDILQECCAVRGQKLLPIIFDGLLWRSRLTIKKMRRVNFFVKHLIQNADGTFNTYLPAVVKLNDPHLIGHPVVSFVFNLLWARLARYSFLRSRLRYLVLVVLVVSSQSVLPRLNPREETEAQRIALFVCRAALYLFDLVPHLIYNIWQLVKDIRARSFVFLWGTVPVPTHFYDPSHAAQLVVTICMLLMLIQEPIFACLGNMNGDFAGAGLFTTHCPQAEARMDVYSVLSEITVLLHWVLITDLCIFSMRLCCYFLTCSRVLVELLHYSIAVLFLILAFSSAIGAYGPKLYDFDSLPEGAAVELRRVMLDTLSLFKIALGMYENQRFDTIREEPQIYTLLAIFTLISLIFLGSLLIAQIAGAFTKLYDDIENYAVLFRAGITVETVRSARPKKWASFLASLKFQERVEFNEGDIGLTGGIQILEPATLNPTTDEIIRRYGGSTDADNPWPEDEFADHGSLEARLKHLEKLVMRATRAMLKSKNGESESHTGSSGSSALSLSHSSGSSGVSG